MHIKSYEEFVNEEFNKVQQINIDELDHLYDYELFDNGNANYYFTTDEPSPNNDDTMSQFLDIVSETDSGIEWNVDGSQAFAKKKDGSEIQIDAGGDGDFTHHIISVTCL